MHSRSRRVNKVVVCGSDGQEDIIAGWKSTEGFLVIKVYISSDEVIWCIFEDGKELFTTSSKYHRASVAKDGTNNLWFSPLTDAG